jgi:hypothetical protein
MNAFNRQAWRSFVFFLKILWVCRISTFSAVAGILLFYYVVQAQNLLADTSFNYSFFAAVRHWVAFFVGLFFLWAFPVHYAARRILDEDSWMVGAAARRRLNAHELRQVCDGLRSEHFYLIEITPRILGVLPFVAVLIGLWGACVTVAGASGLAAGRETIRQIWILAGVTVLISVLFWLFVIKRDDLVQRTIRSINTRAPARRPGLNLVRWFIRLSLIGTACIFLLAYFAPIWFTAIAPRAAMIPLLFGSLVLVFGWLVRKSYQHGFPYLLLVVFVCVIVTGINTRLNDVRSFPATDRKALDGRQIDIHAAIARWRSANACENSEWQCPPVLLIATDGGASRAGFATASVIGAVLDRGATENHPNLPSPARNIFAISAVSGGAMGATMIRAALADAAEGNGSPPCKYAHPTWYRFAQSRLNEGSFSWRECLEILASGDFLSPVFVGLAFRDNFAPPTYLLGEPFRIADRAALLEMAWERHYDFVTRGTHPSLQTGEICDSTSNEKTEAQGLCRRFGYLDADPRGRTWLPLLALNGTSVQTGRRIVTTDLVSTFARSNEQREAVYPQAYDFFEMRSTPCGREGVTRGRTLQCAQASTPDAPDILLSTAALNSARFPLITPAGWIETQAVGGFGDSIVDGGYFENSGLTTALDIARVLHNEGLSPIVLTISNEPENRGREIELPPRPAVTPSIARSEVAGLFHGLRARILGVIASPAETLLNTREGHGSEARDLTVRTLEEFRHQDAGEAKDEIVFFSIGMLTRAKAPDPGASGPGDAFCAGFDKDIEMTKVSMSWWLSSAVQADIDAQLCTAENLTTLDALISRLKQKGS